MKDLKWDIYGAQARIGYSTLKEFCQILKKQNKVCKENNVRVKFEITLPI